MNTKSVIRIFIAIIALYLLTPSSIFAHVKWFASPTSQNSKPYNITDLPVISWIIISIVVITVGILIDRKLKIPTALKNFFQNQSQNAISIASMAFGASLLIFSSQGFLFAPNLTSNSGLFMTLIYLQTLSGLMILLGFFSRIGGVILLFVFLLSLFLFGFIEMLDTAEIVGFAIFTIIINRSKWQVLDPLIIKNLTHQFKNYGLPLLRVFTGANLVILGFSEKILDPSLTSDFLFNYHWNFLHNLGITIYTDYWFAFSAGVVEILFGIFFILGLITRLTTITLSLVLITTMFLLGPKEVIGHLPHFAIALIFIFNGSGNKLKITK